MWYSEYENFEPVNNKWCCVDLVLFCVEISHFSLLGVCTCSQNGSLQDTGVAPLVSITGAAVFSWPDLSNHICTSVDSSRQHLYLETTRRFIQVTFLEREWECKSTLSAHHQVFTAASHQATWKLTTPTVFIWLLHISRSKLLESGL